MNMVMEWASMGGYAPYVWGSYTLVFAGLVLLAVRAFAARAAVVKRLKQLEAGDDGRSRP